MLCNKVVEKREIPNIIKRKNKTINKKKIIEIIKDDEVVEILNIFKLRVNIAHLHQNETKNFYV